MTLSYSTVHSFFPKNLILLVVEADGGGLNVLQYYNIGLSTEIHNLNYSDVRRGNNHAISSICPVCLAVFTCSGDARAAALLSIEPVLGQYFYTNRQLTK